MARTPAKPGTEKTPAEIIAGLTAKQKKAIMDAIMAYPDGCRSRKVDFAKKYGLPVPPRRAQFSVNITVEVDSGDVIPGRYGSGDSLTPEAEERLSKEIAEKAEAAGFTLDIDSGSVVFDGVESDDDD